MRTGIRAFALAAASAFSVLSTIPALAASTGNPADWYHSAAHKYIGGRHQEAQVQAEEGLRLFPDDPALKTLAAHLRKLQDQKRKDQGQGGQSQSDPQGDGKKDPNDQKGEGGEEGKRDEKDKQQPADKQEEKGEPGEDQAKQPESSDEKGKDSTGEAMAPVKPGEMSKEDAERLLNSIQDDEKKEHKQQQRRHRKRVEVEQDW